MRRIWTWLIVAVLGCFVLASCAPAAPPSPTAAPAKPSAEKPAPAAAPAKAAPTAAPAAKPAAKAAEKPAAKAAAQPAMQGKPPTRPVEFVISTSPGGGSDVYARFIIGTIEKNKLSPQPFLPLNKPGGAGAVAMQYVFDKKGDGNTIMITLNSYITTPLLQNLPYKHSDFTPVALLAMDPFFLWVPADSEIKTLADFVKAAQAESLTVAGTGSKQEDEILFNMLQQQLKLKPFKYVPFDGGGAVAAALAGKQVAATVNNPSEGLPHYPDKLRPVVAFLDERSPAFKDLPTAKEQGHDISYFNMRSVVGPPEMSKDSLAWMEATMKGVFDSKDWQDFVTKNALDPKFMGGAEMAAFVEKFAVQHESIMKEVGWIK